MSVPLANFTTYLGYLVKEAGLPLKGRLMDKKTLRISPLIDKNILGEYEATLTICSYFARLNYENRTRKILKMYDALKFTPLVFNKLLSIYTATASTDDKIEKNPASKKISGYLLYDAGHDTPLSITVTDILGVESLVISFRGTISMRTVLKDANISYMNLFALFGKEVFAEEAAEVEAMKGRIINPFGGHRGFVSGLTNVYGKILKRVQSLLETHDVKRIFVTGQSLGGSYANIMGFALAQLKKKGIKYPPIHIVTFGAPATFTQYARDVFNKLLMGGYMTLDRVTNRARFPDPTGATFDIIPIGLPNFWHPGFMILKPEIKTQSRTGRTKHISELRSELADITVKRGLFSRLTSRNYNPLPDYEEFFNKFLDKEYSPGFTAESYSYLLSTSAFGTVRLDTGLATNIYMILEKLTGLSRKKLAESENKQKEEANAAAAEVGPVEVPEGVKEQLEDTRKVVEGAYAKDGQELPGQVQTGGGWYENQTVLENPNQVVYSCSQITAPIPLAGCHLGYMGVGYTGATVNAGSLSSTRGYREEAILYKTNGVWTFSPDAPSVQPVQPVQPGQKTPSQKVQAPLPPSVFPSVRQPLPPPIAPPKPSLFGRLTGTKAPQAQAAPQAQVVKKGLFWGGTAKRRKVGRKTRKARR